MREREGGRERVREEGREGGTEREREEEKQREGEEQWLYQSTEEKALSCQVGPLRIPRTIIIKILTSRRREFGGGGGGGGWRMETEGVRARHCGNLTLQLIRL